MWLEVLDEGLRPWTAKARVPVEFNSRNASDAPAEAAVSRDRVYVVAASLDVTK